MRELTGRVNKIKLRVPQDSLRQVRDVSLDLKAWFFTRNASILNPRALWCTRWGTGFIMNGTLSSGTIVSLLLLFEKM